MTLFLFVVNYADILFQGIAAYFEIQRETSFVTGDSIYK